jgi:hypothetical protein
MLRDCCVNQIPMQACNELSQTWMESGEHSYLESDKTLGFFYLRKDKMLKIVPLTIFIDV